MHFHQKVTLNQILSHQIVHFQFHLGSWVKRSGIGIVQVKAKGVKYH